MAVLERIKELGMLMAIGMNKKRVFNMIMLESVFLSLVGGVLGIVFGVYLGEKILTELLDIYITPTTMAVVLGFGISTTVGLFFGIYPAMKAARLDPIKALSYE